MRLWPFGKRVRELSEELHRELLKTFGIESEDASTMRYVAKRVRLGSGQVNRVCIFNPTILSGPELASANYEKLMTLKGLLFTGHIIEGTQSSNAMVVLNDPSSVRNPP